VDVVFLVFFSAIIVAVVVEWRLIDVRDDDKVRGGKVLIFQTMEKILELRKICKMRRVNEIVKLFIIFEIIRIGRGRGCSRANRNSRIPDRFNASSKVVPLYCI
jgi:hypothetical protein